MPDRSAPREKGRDLPLPDNGPDLVARAVEVLGLAEQRRVSIATAESCTGGLIASLLTDQRGLGKWFDRGFVVYTPQAKQDMLGVDSMTIEREGVVSEAVAKELANKALAKSQAGVAVGVTGFAGPGGPGDETGRVHLAVASQGGRLIHRECHFGDCGRDKTRALAAGAALDMLETALSEA